MNGTITLSVTETNWNLIVTGKRDKLYRAVSEFHRARIQRCIPRAVTLLKEYTPCKITYEVLGVTVGHGDSKYGCDEKKKYYIIHLGKRL